MKLAEILNNLKAPIPPRLIRSKKTWEKGKSSSSVDYVAWFDLCDLLDDLCDYWEWEIKEVKQVTGLPPECDPESDKKPKQKDYLVLTGILTIHGEDKSLTRMATGIEEINCSSYGDPSSNAEAMALRRCCAKFGLGRDLWRKDKPSYSLPSLETTAQVEQAEEHKALPPGQVSREKWLKMKAEREANHG